MQLDFVLHGRPISVIGAFGGEKAPKGMFFFNTVVIVVKYIGYALRIISASALQEGAPKSAQEWRRDNPADPDLREAPPLPAPDQPPSDDGAMSDVPEHDSGDVNTASAEAPKGGEPTAEHVKTFKKHATVLLDGHSRKFVYKDFSGKDSAVLYAAEFRKRCLNLSYHFDGLKRNPTDRKELMMTYGG